MSQTVTEPHPCPFSDANLMAASIIIQFWGNRTLAEKFRSHAETQHPTAAQAATTEGTEQ